MNRREFTVEAALALLGGATITIGCGGGGSSPAAATPPPVRDVVGTVDTNHGHSALLTAAQMGEGNALELDIRGTSGHTHAVTLTAADILNIRNGARVEHQSSGNSHTHVVVF